MPWAGLRLSVTLLTAIPLPGRRDAPGRLTIAAAMYWAPVVGLGVGAACAAVLLLTPAAGPLLASALAVAAGALLTRALHLDGLADFADGLGSARPAEQALEIMKRSDVGPFGVVTLVFVLLIQVSALARADTLGRGPIAIIAAAVTARLAITLACRRGVPAARPGGLGAMVAGTVHPAAGAVLAAAAVAGAAIAGGWQLAAGVGAGLAVSLVLTALAIRRLGGITGDVLGALAEIAATACLLVTALR
ncbi:MAG TPA: adenosylcobinamide-GDP ribazoletransferase [Streptosporangiaceae bacterium]|jgi:adenosylcobinamide-GDP ribazoletransferase|nr:adenosylcobinamide-GDP ribazoletransferase [Streptosporangiaceae bacterium]